MEGLGEVGTGGRRRGEQKRGRGERKSTFKVGFWNVAGMVNKDKEF